MFDLRELVGLPAINVSGGRAGGAGVIFDPGGHPAAYFVLESPAWYEPPRIVEASRVQSLGEHALMFQGADSLPFLWDCPKAMAMARAGAMTEGSDVYTLGGRCVGKPASCGLEADGTLAGCRLQDDQWLPRESIAALVTGMVLVAEAPETAQMPARYRSSAGKRSRSDPRPGRCGGTQRPDRLPGGQTCRGGDPFRPGRGVGEPRRGDYPGPGGTGGGCGISGGADVLFAPARDLTDGSRPQ